MVNASANVSQYDYFHIHICSAGYSGSMCEWGPCNPSPCGQYGTCIDMVQLYGVNTQPPMVCDCDSGYSGDFCHIEV